MSAWNMTSVAPALARHQLALGSISSLRVAAEASLVLGQLGVLGLGLLVDGNVGVGVLPQIQESLVRLPRGGFIAHHLLRAAELEPGQGSRDMFNGEAGMIDQLLELSRGRPAIAELQIGETTDVGEVNRRVAR